MKTPKILAVASAVDLDFRYGCTPAWWQLWKGLHEAGADLIVTPYRGRPVESPWWRTAPNPCYHEGEVFARARDVVARLKGDRYLRRAEQDPGDTDRFVRQAIWRWVTPRWRAHLVDLLERERDVDAVVVFTVPMSHLRGIPTLLRERFGVPVVFYDGDVPMSLPEYGGMDTGFNYYFGADPSEYDLVVSNSEGGLERLRELGARRAEAVFWGADPELFRPHDVEKETDVFFYGYGDKFRQEWTEAMIGEPSRRLDADFVARRPRLPRRHRPGARDRRRSVQRLLARDLGGADQPERHAPRARRTCMRPRPARPFELAMSGATIVSNPHEGIDRWFEPGRELLVVSNAEEATAAYQELLDDPGRAEEMGRAARERALDEHTYLHRARRLLDLLGVGAAPERGRRRPCVADRIAIVPAYNEEESVPRVIAEIRAFDPSLDVVVVDDGSADGTTAAAARAVRTSSACRSTSGSAARSRPVSATRTRTAIGSRCGSTGTASTTLPSSALSLALCSRTRPTSSSARASPGVAMVTGAR